MPSRTYRFAVPFTALAAFVLLALTTACGSGETAESSVPLPAWIAQSNDRVREAYEFAVERPDVLPYVPCYCGCGGIGHVSNQDCFVAAQHPDGSVEFDRHGFT